MRGKLIAKELQCGNDSLVSPEGGLNNACFGLFYKAVLCFNGSRDSLHIHSRASECFDKQKAQPLCRHDWDQAHHDSKRMYSTSRIAAQLPALSSMRA